MRKYLCCGDKTNNAAATPEQRLGVQLNLGYNFVSGKKIDEVGREPPA
jgi:hypothetical protein